MSSILFGTVSRDRYLESGRTLPGGGVLNMAYHWAAAGKEFLLQRAGAIFALKVASRTRFVRGRMR